MSVNICKKIKTTFSCFYTNRVFCFCFNRIYLPLISSTALLTV